MPEDIPTLILSPGYEPGHIEQRYGQGHTILGSLESGDLLARFTVNGEWRFAIGPNEYERPEDITPEIEDAIRDKGDGDEVTFDGAKHLFRSFNNNWFEVFVLERGEEGWEETEDYGVWEGGDGPSVDEMQAILEEAIEGHGRHN